jgi:hypothetical protein
VPGFVPLRLPAFLAGSTILHGSLRLATLFDMKFAVQNKTRYPFGCGLGVIQEFCNSGIL